MVLISRIFAFCLALSWAPAQAQAPSNAESLGLSASGEAGQRSAPLLLAAAQAPMNFTRLGLIFDAASPRLPEAVNIPHPAIRGAQRQLPSQEQPAPQPIRPNVFTSRPSDRRLWAPPVPEAETPAYRRTFRAFLAHPEKTDRYDELILQSAKAHALDPRLLKSIIAAESEFEALALSPRGARGLMQVMPPTAEEMGVPRHSLWEPQSNIRAGAAYLAHLFSAAWRRYKLKGVRFSDAPPWLKERIVAAYNAGPRFLFQNRRFRQTRDYVRKVMLFYRSRVTDFRRSPKALGALREIPMTPSAGTLY